MTPNEGHAPTDVDLTALARRRRLPAAADCARIRRAAGLTLTEMAKYVNVHRTTINEWELGHATPRGVWRERYADVLRQLQVADTDRAGDDDAA